MNAMATILWLSWVLALPAPGDDAPAREADDLRGRVQALVQPMLEKKQSVGVVVGVIEAGRTHVFGFGREVLGGDKPPDGKTIFEIGSVTKVFTSLALADMAEEGLVRLDDPVQRYLPEEVKVASRSGREITLEDLATHTSGLPRIPGNLIVLALKIPRTRTPTTRRRISTTSSRPGSPRATSVRSGTYSNVGAGLLGHALSRRAGLDYGRLIATRISEPLGMSDTKVTLNDEQEKRLAKPYQAGGKPATRWTLDVLAGAGALHSTVDDLLVFLSAELGIKESKLRPAMEATQKPRRETGQEGMRIGLGWLVMKLPKDGPGGHLAQRRHGRIPQLRRVRQGDEDRRGRPEQLGRFRRCDRDRGAPPPEREGGSAQVSRPGVSTSLALIRVRASSVCRAMASRRLRRELRARVLSVAGAFRRLTGSPYLRWEVSRRGGQRLLVRKRRDLWRSAVRTV